MKNTSKAGFFTNLGVFSSFLLVSFSAVYLYSPVIKSHAAEEGSSVVTANIGSIIAITTSTNELTLNANLNSFVHGAIDVNVSTNSQYGYTLTLEDSDNNTNMAATATGITDAFTSSFTGSKSSSDMDGNTWGFALSNTDYFAIPALGSPLALKRTNSPMSTAYETTSVDFGVKVGMITAGTYQDTVKFTAYVNGQDGEPADGTLVGDPVSAQDPNATIRDITTLQEMTSTVCTNTYTPLESAVGPSFEASTDNEHLIPRANLVDARDGKTYMVAKYADGNCWMTQNLALELSATTALTSATTDLNTKNSWTPEFSTVQTYGVGNYNEDLPEEKCDTSNYDGSSYHCWMEDGSDGARSMRPKSWNLYYRGGTEQSQYPNPPYSLGWETNWESTGYHYNWVAATAGSGNNLTAAYTEVGDSICPKGWRLPSPTGEKSWNGLLQSVEGLSENTLSKIYNFPLVLPMAGMIDESAAIFQGGNGYRGYYWSNKSGYRNHAVHLYIQNTGSGSNYYNSSIELDKGFGMSVRCVAR